MEQKAIRALLTVLLAFGPLLILCSLMVLIVALVLVFRLPSVKGWGGEMLMRVGFWLFLPDNCYHVFNNVTIPDNQGGTTQIDHIIVSPYGLFVVETKHYKGWVYGGEFDRQWTQKIHRNHSQKFQNPLLQNYKHVACLRELLDLTQEQVKSVVVFTGECTLKTRDKLPNHVTYPGGCVRYIKRHQSMLFDAETVAAMVSAIQDNRLAPGWRTARQHQAYVHSLHLDREPIQPSVNAGEEDAAKVLPVPEAVAPDQPVQCPRCGGEMVLRTAKRGDHAGQAFWGCRNFPKCRQVVAC